ncbi:MAG: glutaminyl-peptide cyclotransferase [Pseudomonadota bacterium]
MKRSWAICALLALGLSSLANPLPAQHGHKAFDSDRVLQQTQIPVYGYKIHATHPHDTASYTEGLVMEDGALYEGTGLWGQSALRLNDITTGAAIKSVSLSSDQFGEGVTVLGERIYQLTYLGNMGFVYDRETLERVGTFRYPDQGWGLTTDGRYLIKSNGSSAILFIHPETLAVERTIYVSDATGPVGFLNELEWVNGLIFANVWRTPFIAGIEPSTGSVSAWIDLTGLNPDPETLIYPKVLNGIAYDDRTGRLIVTGKMWPKLWEIELVPRALAGSPADAVLDHSD